MKTLFQIEGSRIDVVDEDNLVFEIGDKYYNKAGVEVPYKEEYEDNEPLDDEEYVVEKWYNENKDVCGLEEPLMPESTTEVIDKICFNYGNYGYKNRAGEFVIEPQYSDANFFYNGLALVNLKYGNYCSNDGVDYNGNHFGFIDGSGKMVIDFKYREATSFNKYGVAVVVDSEGNQYMIDKTGTEIPGTRFEDISMYMQYEDRFVEFSYDEYGLNVGLYDTKERKILLEPSVESTSEHGEDCILIYKSAEFGGGDWRQHYINSKGEVLYPWLYGKGFATVEIPDENDISAVSITKFTEITEAFSSGFEHNGKMYNRDFFYGLYSKKEEYLIPLEYEEIKHLTKNMWACYKDGIITVVETEKGD